MTTRACMNTFLLISTLTGLTICLQSVCGKFAYGPYWESSGLQAGHMSWTFWIVWAWFIGFFVPVFFVLRSGLRKETAKKVDWFAFMVVFVYSLLPFFTLWIEPFTQTFEQDMVIRSLYWMFPMLALTIAGVLCSIKVHECRALRSEQNA